MRLATVLHPPAAMAGALLAALAWLALGAWLWWRDCRAAERNGWI